MNSKLGPALWILSTVVTFSAAPACLTFAAETAATPAGGDSLFAGQSLDGWKQIPADSWTVKDGAMSSLGTGRGVIYTAQDFAKYRLFFTMRHVGAEKGRDHQACFLIFCTRPSAGEKPLDALAGIQFQPPNGGHWDYRPGHNDDGRALFERLGKPNFDPHQWSRVEILVDAAAGTARMAVAQPVGTPAVEVLRFRDPSAGKTGPLAWQMHNAGLYDEYKDITVEINPKIDGLITTKSVAGASSR
jgi:3-keto-disaccharide hydrolase